jgi:hypothetical protein
MNPLVGTFVVVVMFTPIHVETVSEPVLTAEEAQTIHYHSAFESIMILTLVYDLISDVFRFTVSSPRDGHERTTTVFFTDYFMHETVSSVKF